MSPPLSPPYNSLHPVRGKDIIDLCSPNTSPRQQRQQHEAVTDLLQNVTGQEWQYQGQGRAAAGAGAEQAKSRLHKELTEFAVMATATQVQHVPLNLLSQGLTPNAKFF